MNKKVINAALLGLGTVGTGVYKVLKNQEAEMEKKIGATVKLKKILVRNLKKAAAKIAEPEILTNNWKEILEDESIDIVIEVMGGIEPAKTYIMEALKAGKNVVTANKDLVASHGGELLDCAAANQCDFLFEAAVAGGIPIIRPLKQCLTGNHLSEIVGIVNGTTNFILTKMTQENMEFADALALATKLGYAEADPTADIQGYDAGRKMAIMASIAFNSRVTFENVATEGITRISSKDIRYARDLGCVIKLLGVARNTDTGIEVSVQPMLVSEKHPLASVNDSFNAVFVHGDAVDDAMFYGRGAGELPTASAIVGDVFDIVRDILFSCTGRIRCTCYKTLPIKNQEDIESRFFMRIHASDNPGVLAAIASVLGKYEVSIAQMIQKHKHEEWAELVIVTSRVKEGNFHDALLVLEKMEVVQKISSVIRVYGEDTMTKQLYYEDSYIKEFKAVVLSCTLKGNKFEAVLDRTAFFPEGGGQGADTGVLSTEDSEIKVSDVQEVNGEIVHYIDEEILPGQEVIGKLDFQERFSKNAAAYGRAYRFRYCT